MSDFQHQPHVGEDYGKESKKIAIMGYSHWSDEADHAGATVDCIANVSSGDWPDLAFFNNINGYFGGDASTFWKNKVFFNFLPRNIGSGDNRFAWGSKADTEEGKARFMTILEEHKPDLLFVFSRKAWTSLPKSLEDQRGDAGGAQIHRDYEDDRQHYRLSDGHVVQAFGLRHPQGASKEEMKTLVSAAQEMQPQPPA